MPALEDYIGVPLILSLCYSFAWTNVVIECFLLIYMLVSSVNGFYVQTVTSCEIFSSNSEGNQDDCSFPLDKSILIGYTSLPTSNEGCAADLVTL